MANPNEKIPYFKPILSGRLPNFGDHNTKVASNIEWETGDPLEFGLLIITANGMLDPNPYTTSQSLSSLRFSITTGKVITKEGKKYYEVYPELYDYEQARILASAFKMIKRSDHISKEFCEKKTPTTSLDRGQLHPFHATQLKFPNGI